MAKRQGGSFNSILGRRKSPLASLSSEQQSARGKNLRGKKHIIIIVSELTFLVLGRPTAPGCLCLWGTLFCVGGRPPSLSFFRYFICQIIAAATLSHSNHTLLNPTIQPSLVRWEKAGLDLTDATGSQWQLTIRLKVCFFVLSVCCFDVDSCDINKRDLKKKLGCSYGIVCLSHPCIVNEHFCQ